MLPKEGVEVKVCYPDHLLLTPLMKAGFSRLKQYKMTEHTTRSTGQMRPTAVNLSRLLHTMQGRMDITLRNRMNQQRLWAAAGLIVIRGWGDPWFPWEDVIGLFE